MVKLSASKIKTLQSCSWTYFCQYVLKLPRSTNDGARRGTVVHLLLEQLINPRHRKHFDLIKQSGLISSSKACERLVRKSMRREGLVGEDQYLMVQDFVLVALDNDFFVEGFKLEKPEYAFEITNDNPKYTIVGFIDKLGFKDALAKVLDFKTSRNKFGKEELAYNIQSWLYALAVHKLFPKIKKVFVNFLFLKFKKNPLQVTSPTKKELDGFEEYLGYLNNYLEDFGENKACANFGYDNYKTKALCGTVEDRFNEDGTPKWRCPYLMPKDYYVQLDESGKITKSSFEKSELDNTKTIETRHYAGCKRLFPQNYK